MSLTLEGEYPWGHEPRLLIPSLVFAAVRKRLLRGKVKRFALNAVEAFFNSCDVEVQGIKMRCHFGDNHTERYIAIKGIKDQENLDKIVSCLKPGDTFVDIGANCGLYTLCAARQVGFNGRVIAIEPIKEMLNRLTFNVHANEFKNVDLVGVAVGDTSGTMNLYVNHGNHGQTSAIGQAGNASVEIPVKTLVEIIASSKIMRIDALKIDIEGYEDRALLPLIREGSRDLWPRKILIEVKHSDRWKEPCVALLVEFGYTQTWTNKYDVLLEIL